MTQDARDQEQASTALPETQDDHHTVGNEDLAAAFLRDTEVVEEALEDGKKIRRKGIYLLPNLFTTSALFSGFLPLWPGLTVNLRLPPSLFLSPWCWMGWMGALRA